MPLIPNRKQDYEKETRTTYDDEKLRKGTYVVVLQPWPVEMVQHNHPFKRGEVTQSWPLRFEECTSQNQKGRTCTLWIECEPSGAIAATELGEGRWRPLADALKLDETDELNTDSLAWATLKIVVDEKQKPTGFTSWVAGIVRASPQEQVLAADYLCRMHPEVE